MALSSQHVSVVVVFLTRPRRSTWRAKLAVRLCLGLSSPVLDDDEIFQEDTWEVVSAYFEDKGLVRQQLDSFNEFIGTTIQEVTFSIKALLPRP